MKSLPKWQPKRSSARNWLAALVAILSGMSSSPALAGHGIGKVTALQSYNANLDGTGSPIAVIILDNYGGVAQGCSPSGFAFRTDTPTGRAQFAMMLSAWQAGTKIGISGTGRCGVLPNAEDISHVDVNAGW